MTCPRCGKPMAAHMLDGHLGRGVEVDVCTPCQSMWFDARENLQLTPGATLSVFRLIGERVGRPAAEDGEIVKCPRCNGRLRRTRDLQRATRFEYWRCPNDHGRLITFFDFLKEKDFIKPLTAPQIAELRRNVQAINCSNCGAPVDLAAGTECSHCRSPLSMLDLNQAERLIAQLQNADRTGKPIDPALPLALARARRETDLAFRGLPGHEDWDTDTWSLGLVGATLANLFGRTKL
jgi:ssDNA-binding Zn-finger/Zn-ribbon topoisomerase 1